MDLLLSKLILPLSISVFAVFVFFTLILLFRDILKIAYRNTHKTAKISQNDIQAILGIPRMSITPDIPENFDPSLQNGRFFDIQDRQIFSRTGDH